MKNHLTDTQIRAIKNRFEDNLFETAFYADEESYSDLFSKKKKSTEEPPARKKFNLGNLIEKAKSIADTSREWLNGGQSIAGEFSGIKYNASVDTTTRDSESRHEVKDKEEDNQAKDKKDKDSKLFGMPMPVAICLVIAIAILLLLVALQLTSKPKA